MHARVVERIPLSRFGPDSTVQTRVCTDEQKVERYAALIRDDVKFPPIVVFDDGVNLWVPDGIHRLGGHNLAARESIEAVVKKGSYEDAFIYALGANEDHGDNTSVEDKWHKAKLALAKFGDRSDSAIASMCGVSQPFIGKVRRKVAEDSGQPMPTERVGQDGRTRAAPTTGPAEEREREPGEDEPEPEVKAGKIVYDWELLDNTFGKLTRQIDGVASAHKDLKADEYRQAQKCLTELLRNIKVWKKRLKKEK